MYATLEQFANPIGLLGVGIILIAYLLLSLGRWSAHTISYQLINFIGAWLIIYSLYFHWNLASFVIEVAWAAISLIGIYRIHRRSSQSINRNVKSQSSYKSPF